MGAVQLGASFVPDRADRLGHEGQRVNPVCIGLVGWIVRLTADDAGTVDRNQIAYVGWNRTDAIQYRKRHARLDESQHVGLPPADGEPAHSAAVLSEGKLVIEAVRQAVLDANVRIPPIVGPVVGKNRAYRSGASGSAVRDVREVAREDVVDVN